MLVELHVRDLGVIADLHLLLEAGMTALTGETGAGKTLLVEAIELLMGGRADAVLVRPGAEEARVEGRFVAGESETVLARAVPRNGRSRAYIDGRLATAAELTEVGRALVDLHGQHAHQSLLSPRTQRAALDRFAGVDLAPLQAARDRVKAIDEALAALGGDARARARELDLLRFQLAELDAAGLDDPDEDLALEAEEDTLADAAAHREAAEAAYRSHGRRGRRRRQPWARPWRPSPAAGRSPPSRAGCGRCRPSWPRRRPTCARPATPSSRSPSASTRYGPAGACSATSAGSTVRGCPR